MKNSAFVFLNVLSIFLFTDLQAQTPLARNDSTPARFALNSHNGLFQAPDAGHLRAGDWLRQQSSVRECRCPYSLSWKKDGILLAGSTLLLVTGNQLDNSRTPLSAEKAASLNRRDVPWFDRSATYKFDKDLRNVSDQLGLFALAAPLTLLADKHIRRNIVPVGLMFLETRMLATAVPMFPKRLITRYRPYVYNPDVSYEDKVAKDPGQSFFANQTTSVFSSAVFVATVFSDFHPDSRLKPYVWAGSLLAGGAISYVRYETGIHYTSDILVGALVGSAIGYGIPKLHRNLPEKLSLSPVINGSTYALNVRLTL